MRYATKITLERFKEICERFLFDEEKSFDPYNLSPQMEKDLSKIEFDFENYALGNAEKSYYEFHKVYPSSYEGFCNYPCGYEVLSNGLPVLFVNAGGDWEYPICFCIYYDGKRLRAYIPTEGNVFNRDLKSAYGNNDDKEEFEEIKGDPEKIRNDVMNRIILR